MLKNLLTKETIQIVEQLSHWEEAIQIVAQPLLEKGVIEKTYVEAMIGNVKVLGPYMIIGAEVAIPHARPEMGVNQIGMSFLKLNDPVYFLNNERYPVTLLFCIAAIDDNSHLKALSELTRLLTEKQNIQQLKEATTVEDVLEIVMKYSVS